mmetsp:Transcript_35645/g.70257  ORF Transcript_35645/g.70257 Transcript_35645/m.70257 type:complete len:105 (-) Transcript_35645:288-602(-)
MPFVHSFVLIPALFSMFCSCTLDRVCVCLVEMLRARMEPALHVYVQSSGHVEENSKKQRGRYYGLFISRFISSTILRIHSFRVSPRVFLPPFLPVCCACARREE